MKYLVLALSALGLTACAASVAEYRTRTPTVEYVTAKTPDEAVRCLGGQLEARHDAPIVYASDVGQTLTWAESRRLFIDVIPIDGGSRVVLHQHGVLDAGNKFITAVNACRDPD
ncbi:MAG TPA: hypothetical protein DIV82_00280 [Brevundimonas diminuta]|nr:hypothetical protein [Brevundimonas diminuta]